MQPKSRVDKPITQLEGAQCRNLKAAGLNNVTIKKKSTYTKDSVRIIIHILKQITI